LAGSVLANLDFDQRDAAEIADGPLLIVAGPGTGKTRTLTHRIAHLITERGVAPEHCLAVTFSRRAASEMEERLAALLPDAAGRILVTTFHGLGLTLLRDQAGEPPQVASHEQQIQIVQEILALTPTKAERALEDISQERRTRFLSPLSRRGAGREMGEGPGVRANVEAYEIAL